MIHYHFLYIKSCLWLEIVLFLPFQFLCPFSCLIVLEKSSSLMFNRNSECEYTYIFPKLRGGDFHSFTIKYDVSCEFFGFLVFLGSLYWVENVSYFVVCFYHVTVLDFVKCYFCICSEHYFCPLVYFCDLLFSC